MGEDPEAAFGPWMIAQRNRRRPARQSIANSKVEQPTRSDNYANRKKFPDTVERIAADRLGFLTIQLLMDQDFKFWRDLSEDSMEVEVVDPSDKSVNKRSEENADY